MFDFTSCVRQVSFDGAKQRSLIFKMRSILSTVATATFLISNVFAASVPAKVQERDYGVIKPKVLIISMFGPEGEAWYGIPEFDILAQNITVGGLSPVYDSAVHCTADGDVCQTTIGEAGMRKV